MKENKIDFIKLKQIIIIVVVIVIIVLFFGVSFKESKGSKNYSIQKESTGDFNLDLILEEANAISKEEQADIEKIDVDRYLELKEEDKESLIYISNSTNDYCKAQTPIFKNFVYRYPDARIFYLDTGKLSDKEMKKLNKSSSIFSDNWEPPVTIVVKEGKILNRISGITTGQNILALLKENQIINTD